MRQYLYGVFCFADHFADRLHKISITRGNQYCFNLINRIWGDGYQTDSFTYIDDCLHGIHLVTDGESTEPVNVGSSELVTINQLVDIVEGIAGVTLERNYKLDAPQGVRGRNSDNTMILERYGWQPSTSLADGLERTYRWIHDQMST